MRLTEILATIQVVAVNGGFRKMSKYPNTQFSKILFIVQRTYFKDHVGRVLINKQQNSFSSRIFVIIGLSSFNI